MRAARLPPILASDGAFIVEQTAKYRGLSVAFTWRSDALPPPEVDFLAYERERDAETARFVAALERRSARTELAWVGATPVSSDNLAAQTNLAVSARRDGEVAVFPR